MNFEKIEIDPDLEDIIEPFIVHTLADLDKIEKAGAENDLEEIKSVCHRILGSASSYGFLQLEILIQELQTNSKGGSSEKLIATLKDVREYKSFLIQEFKPNRDS